MSRHISRNLLGTQEAINTNSHFRTKVHFKNKARFKMKTEIRIDSSLDLYNKVVQDMADALSESSKGDEWGKDIARKKISEMKFKLKLIEDNL